VRPHPKKKRKRRKGVQRERKGGKGKKPLNNNKLSSIKYRIGGSVYLNEKKEGEGEKGGISVSLREEERKGGGEGYGHISLITVTNVFPGE